MCAHTNTKFDISPSKLWIISSWEHFSRVWLITAKGKLFPDYSRSTYIEEIMVEVNDFITIREVLSVFWYGDSWEAKQDIFNFFNIYICQTSFLKHIFTLTFL